MIQWPPTEYQGEQPPRRIPIKCLPDSNATRYIGHERNGCPFMVMSSFVYNHETGAHREFEFLHRFNPSGVHVKTTIASLGPRDKDADARHRKACQKLLAMLDGPEFGDIAVQPFRVVHDGIEIGLIPQPPEAPDDDWSVIHMPDNCLALVPPWDGWYDT